jgi:DNA adenine methylase
MMISKYEQVFGREAVPDLSQAEITTDAPPQPLLKWAGGKRGIIPQLQGLMPEDVRPSFEGRLVEPFIGGAAMFFYLKPREALLADVNEDLIALYLAARDSLNELKSALDELDSLPYTAESYYGVRESEPSGLVERAARLVLLNRWGWNGLYRVNKKGKFNVPFGRTSTGRRPRLYDRDNLRAASELLKRAEITVAPFEVTLERVETGDFAYLDPPYHPISATSAFTSYTKLDFSIQDQERLRDAILLTEQRTRGGARIMLSNSVAPELVELYERRNNLRLHTVVAFRGISARASSRGGQPELVVTNY